MGEKKLWECPICHEQIKVKRLLVDHIVEQHGLTKVEAVAKIFNTDLSDGHVHCAECGKIIPDETVLNRVLGKGKALPKYCSMNCQKHGSLRQNSKIAHANLREELRMHRLYPDDPKYRNRAGIGGRAAWEKAKQDPERKKKVLENLQKGWDFSKENFINSGRGKQRNRRIYIVKVFDGLDSKYKVKIGTGNPWRRWQCILSLLPEMRVVDFAESVNYVFDCKTLEYKMHLKFSDHKTDVPNKVGRFKLGKDRFEQNTGYTEWFDDTIFDDAVSFLSEQCEVHHCTSEFLKFMKKGGDVKLLKVLK